MKDFEKLNEGVKDLLREEWEPNKKKNGVTFSPYQRSISDALTQRLGKRVRLQLWIHKVDAPNQIDIEFHGQFKGRADLTSELRALLLNKELFPTFEEPDGTTIIIRLPLHGNHEEQTEQIRKFIKYLNSKLSNYQPNSGAITPTPPPTTLESSIREMIQNAKEAKAQSGKKTTTVQKHKEVRFETDEDFKNYLAQLHEAQVGLCALSGLQLQPYTKDGLYSVSLDRINSDGHYEAGNLQLVCRFINLWKSDTDDEQFKQLLAAVRAVPASQS
jgi:hypothetical protein